ncbi:SRPBCC family protein [soil metagenome]
METTEKTVITIEITIEAPIEKVWKYWTKPEHIIKWNNASEDWHTPSAKNDLRKGGSFVYRMEAKNGSMGFDFGGVFDEVINHKYIENTLDDGRKVTVTFTDLGNAAKVVESFEAEDTNPIEMQRGGWQNILDSFKKYIVTNVDGPDVKGG